MEVSDEKNDVIFSIFTIILGVIIIVLTKNMPRGASIFPLMIGGLLILLGLILLGTTIRAKYPVKGISNVKIPFIELALFIILLVLFYFVFERIGYIIATALVIFLTTILSNYKKYKVSAITSIVISVAMFFIFAELFGVMLPSILF